MPIEACYSVVGARIRAMRINHGWTMPEMARQMGITRAAVSLIEVGQQRLLVHRVLDIAKLLGVPVGELLDVDGPMPVARDVRAIDRMRKRLAAIEENKALLTAALKKAEKVGGK